MANEKEKIDISSSRHDVGNTDDRSTDRLIDFQEVTKLLHVGDQQAYRELRKAKIQGKRQPGEGNKKFYPELAIKELAFQRGAGSGLNPKEHELTLYKGATEGLALSQKDIAKREQSLISEITELAKKLGTAEHKATYVDAVEEENTTLRKRLESAEKQLQKQQIMDQARKIIKGNNRLLIGLAVFVVLLVWVFSAPLVSMFIKPLYEAVNTLF